MQGLSVGRIVHYVGSGDEHLAAIVTGVQSETEGTVNIQVFPNIRSSVTWLQDVPYSGKMKVDTWHWPERE